MLGLLLKVNFSQEKLSLYSLMLVLDTIGTSSPEMVPAVGGKRVYVQCIAIWCSENTPTKMRLQHIIMNPLMGLSSHLEHPESSHEQLLCLNCI